MQNKDEKDKQKFNFKPIGEAIKKERLRKHLTREQASYLLRIEARYLTNIENKGQHPSLDVFSRLVDTFNISVDQYFLKHDEIQPNSTQHLHLLETLSNLSSNEVELLQYLADGLIEQKSNRK